MTPTAESISTTSRRGRGLFRFFLIAFANPARWPAAVVYLLAALMAGGLAWLWATQAGSAGNALLVFLIMGSFFASDRDMLAGLPRRGISFAPWAEQFFALAVSRAAVALIFGLLIPVIGWPAAFYTNIALQFTGTLALYQGAVIEPRRLTLSNLRVAAEWLPAGSEPIRILHVTDLHIERLGVREAQLIEHIRAAAPDFIFLTGDYVNISNGDDPVTHGHIRDLLEKLSAPGGVFAVLGSPAVDRAEVVPPLFEGLPVRLLRDEVVELTTSGGQPFRLLGLDCHHHDLAGDAQTLERLAASGSGSGPTILLYHSPELMRQAVEHKIDLYLCGHTHGGQIRLPILGPVLTSSRLGRRYVMGHYHEAKTHLYVSRGVGFEGLGAPRVRFLCPPEITLVEWVAEDRAN
jgi:predicted MPP superfamily phosphohydrolase